MLPTGAGFRCAGSVVLTAGFEFGFRGSADLGDSIGFLPATAGGRSEGAASSARGGSTSGAVTEEPKDWAVCGSCCVLGSCWIAELCFAISLPHCGQKNAWSRIDAPHDRQRRAISGSDMIRISDFGLRISEFAHVGLSFKFEFASC